MQDRSHQVWSGHVPGACVSRYAHLEAMRLLLKPVLGQCDASQKPDVLAFQSFTNLASHAPFADVACDTIIVNRKFFEGETPKSFFSHCLQSSRKFQMCAWGPCVASTGQWY